MPGHFHLSGAEVLKFLALYIIVNFMTGPLVAHHRTSPWAQGLAWDLGHH